MLLKYTIFNSIFLFATSFAIYFYNAFGLLWYYDVTKVSFLLLGIYVLLTISLIVFKDEVIIPIAKWIGPLFPIIGLCGTVVGNMIFFKSLSSVANLDSVHLVSYLLVGVAPIFLTTLFGLLCFLFTSIQLQLYFGEALDE